MHRVPRPKNRGVETARCVLLATRRYSSQSPAGVFFGNTFRLAKNCQNQKNNIITARVLLITADGPAWRFARSALLTWSRFRGAYFLVFREAASGVEIPCRPAATRRPKRSRLRR